MKLKIAVIESDRRTERLLKTLLEDDYELQCSSGLAEGLSAVAVFNPDIIIFDPLYPQREGLELIASVREWSDCRIIAVCENPTEAAAVKLLESGADDYVRKPFFPSELKARVGVCAAHIRALNEAKGIKGETRYSSGELSVDFNTLAVTLKGEKIHLTKNELKILSLLCKHSGKLLTYEYILKAVWGPNVGNDTGILRVNIANLRRKLGNGGKDYIFTQSGVGYRAAENELLR